MSRAQSSGVAALVHDYRNFAGPRLWLAGALMILGSIAEGFGLLMIVPLASIAIGQQTASWVGLPTGPTGFPTISVS